MLNPNKVQSDRRYGLSRAGSRALDLCFITCELRFSINTVPGSASIWMKKQNHSLLELPLSVVQRTHLSGLQPARDAVEMKRMLQNQKHRYNTTEQTVYILNSFDWLVDVCVIKLTLQTPQATVHSSDVADAWLAWHSIPEGRWTGLEQPRQLTK